MKIDPNAPAFPRAATCDAAGRLIDSAKTGMTYRQWLVGMIAQGMAAGTYWGENVQNGKPHEFGRSVFSESAIAQADSIIAALNAEDTK